MRRVLLNSVTLCTKKNKILTFASLYDAEQTAYESGRSVTIDKILCHELLPIPLALAQMNGDLRTGTKSILRDVLSADVPCPHALNPNAELGDNPSIIIDRQALVCAIGKPKDLSGVFRSTVLNVGASFNQINLTGTIKYPSNLEQGEDVLEKIDRSGE